MESDNRWFDPNPYLEHILSIRTSAQYAGSEVSMDRPRPDRLRLPQVESRVRGSPFGPLLLSLSSEALPNISPWRGGRIA